jgi:hypothetical protein
MSSCSIQALAAVLVTVGAGIPLPAMHRAGAAPAAGAPAPKAAPAGLAPGPFGMGMVTLVVDPVSHMGYQFTQGRATIQMFPGLRDWTRTTFSFANHKFGTLYHPEDGLKFMIGSPVGDQYTGPVDESLSGMVAEFWKDVDGEAAIHGDVQHVMTQYVSFMRQVRDTPPFPTVPDQAVWDAFEQGYLASATRTAGMAPIVDPVAPAAASVPPATVPPAAPAPAPKAKQGLSVAAAPRPGALAPMRVNTAGTRGAGAVKSPPPPKGRPGSAAGAAAKPGPAPRAGGERTAHAKAASSDENKAPSAAVLDR